MIQRVISGGQVGVDMAALRAAKACGIPTGGHAPAGWKTEAGPAPWLADYGLMQCTSPNYAERTRMNVADSDATLVLTHRMPLTGGTRLTLEMANKIRHGWISVLYPKGTGEFAFVLSQAEIWLERTDPFTLNVAGPRESKCPGIGALAEAFLTELFAALREGQRP
jgi:hypothetical protein